MISVLKNTKPMMRVGRPRQRRRIFRGAIGLLRVAALIAVSCAVGNRPAFAQPTQFFIQSTNSGLVLDVPGGSQTPSYIQQYPQNGGANQLWTVQRKPGNYAYEIVSVGSSLVLDDPGFSTVAGPIQQYYENGGVNQQWTIAARPTSDGNSDYEIVSSYSGLVLDVPNASTLAGVHIQQYPATGNPNQLWEFKAAPGSPKLLVSGTNSNQSPILTMNGLSFTPGQTLRVVFMGLPAEPSTAVVSGDATGIPPITVAPNGTFAVQVPVHPTSTNWSDTFLRVTVGVEDTNGNLVAITDTSAGTFVSL
jgi:hypothetical protein